MFRLYLITPIAMAIGVLVSAAPASALTMAECSAKYNSAKDAGTLDGQTWNQFRKSACTADAADTKPKATDAAAAAPAKGLTMSECSAKYNAAKEAGTLGGQTWNQFRSASCSADAQKASTTKKATADTAATAAPAKGLTMTECSAKYNAAKGAGTLGGQTWNQFRSAECSADAQKASTTKKATTDTAAAAPAKGLTMKACSAKYGAAKDAGTLGGLTWNQYRKAECGPGAADDDTVPYIGQAKYTGDPVQPSIVAPRGVTFPRAVARKYADETPGKGRMHTCLEQYYANKDNDSLGGLRWIQKGGGYYSLCNAKLKANLAG